MKSILCLLLVISYLLTLVSCSSPLQTATLPPSPTPTPTAMQACWEEPQCRLDVSSDQLRSLYEATSTWNLEDDDSVDGTRVHSALSHDGQISVQWFEEEGVILVMMIASVPNAFSNWSAPSVEAELRRLFTAVIPPPWESDYAGSTMSIWFGLESNPASRENPPNGIVKGVVIQINYIPEVPAVSVSLWKYPDSLQ